jgi:hypothetical protein
VGQKNIPHGKKHANDYAPPLLQQQMHIIKQQ